MTLIEILKEAFSFETSIDPTTGLTIGLTAGQAILIMLLAMVCGGLICLTYRLTYRGAVFSRSFCLSLFTMSLIVTLLIMAIRSNIYLSLGTLGALSIIRFRTAVKEPMDMAFLLLSISAGIICGANLLSVALLGTLFVCAILIILHFLPATGGTYIVMVTMEAKAEDKVCRLVKSATARHALKSKSHTGGVLEVTWEVCLKKGDDGFVREISHMSGVNSAVIVRSTTEYI